MKGFKLALIIVALVVSVIALCVVFVYTAKNTAIGIEEQVNTAKSEINTQEKRRGDLIPNLVECVKAYNKHEYDTLLAIIAERGTSDDVASSVQIAVNAVAEAYPELSSSANYKQLMTELAVTENLIANYRNSYNNRVKEYNTFVRQFPHEFFFGLTGYTPVEYTYLAYETSETAPVVNFN